MQTEQNLLQIKTSASNDIQNVLKKYLLLDSFTEVEMSEVLNLCKVLNFEKDAVILKEGQPNDKLMLLVTGKVTVFKLGERLMSYEIPGTPLGEMSLITKSVCSASIITDEESTVLSIHLGKISELLPNLQDKIQNSIFHFFSIVLADKLAVATEKARLFEITNRELQRTQELLATKSAGRIGEISQDQAKLLGKLEGIIQQQELLIEKNTPEGKQFIESIEQFKQELKGAQKKVALEKVIVFEKDANEQIQIRMAFGSIGASVTFVSNVSEFVESIEQQSFDVLCVSEGFFPFLKEVLPLLKDQKIVYLTAEPLLERIKICREFPKISAIVVKDARDKVFTMRNLATTVRKLISEDIFGLDKYLSWGTDVKIVKVKGSEERREVIESMTSYFTSVGVGRILLSRCTRVAEEMLMNAIYDAPADIKGNALYNHLSREVPILLPDSDQPVFRYACDGSVVAISCEDRFGGLALETILKYLEKCIGGEVGESISHKGGGGNGLFQSIQCSSLYVFNVKKGKRTEVIALFSTALQFEKIAPIPSFHYFSNSKL